MMLPPEALGGKFGRKSAKKRALGEGGALGEPTGRARRGLDPVGLIMRERGCEKGQKLLLNKWTGKRWTVVFILRL